MTRSRRLGWLVPAALLLAPAGAARAALVYDKGTATAKPSVYIAADDGSSPRRLATGGAFPHISPDGLTVVYEAVANKANKYKPRLMKIPAAGGTPTVLLSPVWLGYAFAWSPDSRTLATVGGPEVGRKRLVLVDVAAGTNRTVARGVFNGVSFSPTGASIVYGRAPGDRFPLSGSEIYTAPVAGGAPTAITTRGRSVGPVWGPTSIAFARQRKPPRKRLGGRLVADAPKQDLYLINPDGSGMRRLTRTKVPFLLNGLTATEWSTDGTRLLGEFVGQDTDYAETVNPADGRVRHVGRLRDGVIGARLSGDGTTILAATGGFEPGPHHNVVTYPYGGGAATVLVRRAGDPDWTR